VLVLYSPSTRLPVPSLSASSSPTEAFVPDVHPPLVRGLWTRRAILIPQQAVFRTQREPTHWRRWKEVSRRYRYRSPIGKWWSMQEWAGKVIGKQCKGPKPGVFVKAIPFEAKGAARRKRAPGLIRLARESSNGGGRNAFKIFLDRPVFAWVCHNDHVPPGFGDL